MERGPGDAKGVMRKEKHRVWKTRVSQDKLVSLQAGDRGSREQAIYENETLKRMKEKVREQKSPVCLSHRYEKGKHPSESLRVCEELSNSSANFLLGEEA